MSEPSSVACPTCGAVFHGLNLKNAKRKLSGHMSGKHGKRGQPGTTGALPREAVTTYKPARPVQDRQTRVVWTDDELYTLIQAAARALLQNPLSDPLHLLRDLQEQHIVVERRRPLGGWGAVPEDTRSRISNEFQRLLDAEKKEAVDAALAEKPPEICFGRIEVEVAPDPVKFLREQETARLITELLARATEALKQIGIGQVVVSNRMDSAPPVQAAPVAEFRPASVPITTERPRLLRLGIVGLFKHQFDSVAEKCAEYDLRVELVWLDKTHSPSLPPSLQAVIIDSHVPHLWSDAARKRFRSNEVLFSNGGTTAVVQRVRDFLSMKAGVRA